MESIHNTRRHEAWNKGKLVGQKAPFKLKEIWAIRVRLQMQERLRELALFDLGIDRQAPRLRSSEAAGARRVPWRPRRHASCGVATEDSTSGAIRNYASIREALEAWMKRAGLKTDSFLFPGRVSKSPHLGTR